MAIRTTKAAVKNGNGVWRKGIITVETNPMRVRVTRSPRQEATGGAMLSGSQPKWRQPTMRAHMKLPSTILDRHAADIDVATTITNLG